MDTALRQPRLRRLRRELRRARATASSAADELLPTLREALAEDTVSVIACPVDYSANLQLTDALGELDESLS